MLTYLFFVSKKTKFDKKQARRKIKIYVIIHLLLIPFFFKRSLLLKMVFPIFLRVQDFSEGQENSK